jgi:hypothetical protein
LSPAHKLVMQQMAQRQENETKEEVPALLKSNDKN